MCPNRFIGIVRTVITIHIVAGTDVCSATLLNYVQ